VVDLKYALVVLYQRLLSLLDEIKIGQASMELVVVAWFLLGILSFGRVDTAVIIGFGVSLEPVDRAA